MMTRERLEELVLRHLEGGLGPREFRELEAALLEDPEAANLLRDLADAQLFLSENLGRPLPAFTPSPRSSRGVRAVAAAAAIVVLAVILWLVVSPGGPLISYEGEGLLVFTRSGELPGASAVEPGTRYLVRSGVLTLGSVRLSVKAPAVLTIPQARPRDDGRWPINLEAGRVFIETPDGGQGVEILTPRGSVQDIGTRFELHLNDDMEVPEMIARIRTGALPTFVTATVLSGLVSWQSEAGEQKNLTPEMGTVTLAHDASVGAVIDREGLAYVRPVNGSRWTLANEKTRLETGDWVKTAARGANAVEVLMRDGARLVLGPGGLLEVPDAGTVPAVRLYRGELEIKPVSGTTMQVKGPDGAVQAISQRCVLRSGEKALITLTEDQEPRWLEGYREKSVTEAMGELLAEIDGRTVPLTIGYHKVTVDIRDQIARTVVEESFVNTTDQELEGTFYFPLPQDASISGFAMWIRGELVEADVVEKQRAREIFEQIMREKRDPALLEWTGGSMFKARVYPIPAHGEKRIRITYTEVLPKEGTTYGYTYALRSELLTQTPLRRLEVAVTISSVEELASVVCTSHMARTRKTDRAARVEFSAEEYTPTRDFEVLISTKPTEQNLVVIPHLRDTDGYFMALLGTGGDGTGRKLLGDSEPLDCVLIADTSGSMTAEQLAAQRLFIASLIESAGEKDRFNLLTFDVTAAWAFDAPVPVTADNREKAMAFLERRGALGWTDLRLAFEEAVARAQKDTHVIYVGDGIPTTGDADPAAAAAAIKRLYTGHGTFHAVAVGSTYEGMVLKAIASLGQGSLRTVGDPADAPQAALDLLSQITSPGMRDISLTWDGISVARVYPDVLPNLPAGRQQIILGRYLPAGSAMKGSVTVTGTAGGKQISRTIPVSFAGAETGNAFIPRLWARMHLDHLLEQGQSSEVRDQIIALSENYQIMTPYTSFLVLESDADRERFGVKKRLRMEGGELFFAQGRDAAAYELTRQQMLKALKWRQGIRDAVLTMYLTRGLKLRASGLSPQQHWEHLSRMAGRAGDFYSYGRRGEGDWRYAERRAGSLSRSSRSFYGRESFWTDDIQGLSLAVNFDDPLSFAGELNMIEMPMDPVAVPAVPLVPYALEGALSVRAPAMQMLRKVPAYADGAIRSRYAHLGRRRPGPPPQPFAAVFKQPGPAIKPLEGKWPKKIRELVEKLSRRSTVSAIAGGIRVTCASDHLDVRNRVRPGARTVHLLSAQTWTARTEGRPGDIPSLRWLAGGRRGVCDLARLLGSTRKAEENDARSYPSPLGLYFDDLERQFGGYTPELVTQADTTILKLVPKNSRHAETHVVIDTKRQAIIEVTRFVKGKKTSTRTFSDFVELAGATWPRTVEWRNEDGTITQVKRISYEELAAEPFTKAVADQLSPTAGAILLSLPLPEVTDAKQRALDGTASIHDRWKLMNHFGATQKWDDVRDNFTAFGEQLEGKTGIPWIRLAVLKASRRNEEARTLILDLADAIVKQRVPAGEFGLAEALYKREAGSLQTIEKLELLGVLKPVLERQDTRLEPMKTYHLWRLGCLDHLRHVTEAFALRGELAAAYPYDIGRQTDYANALARRGDVDAGTAHLARVIAEQADWTEKEIGALRRHAANLLYDNRRLRDFLTYADRHLTDKPKRVTDDCFNRYLSALVMLDREAEADAKITAWMQGARGDEPGPIEAAQLNAAIAHGMGGGRDLHNNTIEQRWLPGLCDVVRAFILNEDRYELANRIYQSYNFRRTDKGGAMVRELYLLLAEKVNDIAGATLHNLYGQTRYYGPNKEEPQRDAINTAIFKRWEQETDPRRKSIFESTIVSYCGGDLTLKLRRIQLSNAAGEEERSQRAGEIFGLLSSRSWDSNVEAELRKLIPMLGYGNEKLITQINAVQVFARYLTEKRAQHLIEQIPDRNKKSKRQLTPLEDQARRTADAEAVERLKNYEASDPPDGLLPFVRLERLTIQAKLIAEPARVAEELEAIVTALPEPKNEDEGKQPDPITAYREALAERCFLVLGYLATRPKADPALGDGILTFLKEAVAQDSKKADIKINLYRLLVALDRPGEIEKTLRVWAEEAGTIGGNRWRVPYAYVLAEQGKLAGAIEVFESVEKVDELGPAEYRALSDWHMALDAQAQHTTALERAYEVMNDWQIHQSLRRELGRYTRTGESIPEELDQTVFMRFRAALRKTGRPRDHLRLLKEYYEATKDFRLLEAIPDAVIGQTAAKIYDFLGHLRAGLSLIGDEATINRMARCLAERRTAVKTDVDRRALNLLEYLIERRACDQTHGAGQHLTAAHAAIQKAFKGAWAPGEPVLMARFLEAAVTVVEPLRSEQLRQLRLLHTGAEAGSQECFDIARARAATLWKSEAQEESLEVLGGALNVYRKAHDGRLPEQANEVLSEYVDRLGRLGRFMAAEAVWRAELAGDYNRQRRLYYTSRLFEHYARALGAGAPLSIGEGEELYTAARDEIISALARRTNESHAHDLVGRLCAIYAAGYARKFSSVKTDLRAFGFQTLPETLRMYQYRKGQDMVRTVADRFRTILGSREALSFLVTRAETEPGWIRRQSVDFWNRFGDHVSHWRTETKRLGDLEPRLLAVVLKELKQALLRRSYRHNWIYYRHSGKRANWFWKEKEGDFLQTARAVIQEKRGSEAGIRYVASYLYHGIGRSSEAIEELSRLYRQGSLGRDGRRELVGYLHGTKRYAESIPILAGPGGLVDQWPHQADNWTNLMVAYHKTNETEKLRATLKDAEQYFRKEDRWKESAIAQLANACLTTHLHKEAIPYFDEAIALRRKAVDAGQGDRRLSRYYSRLAETHAGLGNTRAAVDAAAGAIVSWGRDEKNRKGAVASLHDVLKKAHDLEAYAAWFDKDCTKTRKEKPIIRKALGQVLIQRERYADAVPHLEACAQIGSFDAAVYRLLIEAYEKSGNAEKASASLLTLARRSGHTLELYKELGERWATTDTDRAERAYTTLVEQSAHESEGHALLAGVRESQRRFLEAAGQWRHVTRIRSQEPTGYLNRARCLIKARRNDEAREILEQILGQQWPERFKTAHDEARKLLETAG